MKIRKSDLISKYAQSIGLEAATELICKKINAAAIDAKENFTGEDLSRICGELAKEGGLVRIIAQAFLVQSERKKSEEQALLLDNIETQIWYLSDIETCGGANKACADFWGVEKVDLECMNLYEMLDKEQARVSVAANREVFEKKKQIHTEEWIKNGRGNMHLLSITRTPKIDDKGDVEYIICATEDITERKREERARERLLSRLDAKNKELESFVFTISHDLKAPLVSMSGFSSLLKKEFQDPLGKEGKRYLDRIQANLIHMNDLLTHLLDLSRIGRVVGPIEEIDVTALLMEIQNEQALRLKEIGAEFVVQEPLPIIRADRTRIRQVFANLIDNAIKFKSEERLLRIEVGCQKEEFYRFYVADNGIGIPLECQEQIFGPFRQLDEKAEGVGMGLCLIRKIVEHHGGRIWMESKEGEGSTFYFTLQVR